MICGDSTSNAHNQAAANQSANIGATQACSTAGEKAHLMPRTLTAVPGTNAEVPESRAIAAVAIIALLESVSETAPGWT